MDKLTRHQANLILAVVEQYMKFDLREKLAREVPDAYNAWTGGTHAIVVKSDGREW